MTHQAQFNDQEWQLVLELLQTERGELHPEVRRSTMNLEAHDQLHERLKMVENLIERLARAPVQ
jgi:Trp operon repressor